MSKALLVLGVLALAVLADRPGRADAVTDCSQDVDPAFNITGCTALIEGGGYSDSDLAWAYFNRGNAHRSLGQSERAVSDYDEAISLDPDFVDAYLNCGGTYSVLGEHLRDIQDLDQALQFEPMAADIYINRGNAYAKLGRPDRALSDYDQAVHLDPAFAYAYWGRGSSHFRLDQYELAVEDYDQALAVGGLTEAEVAVVRESRARALEWLAWQHCNAQLAEGPLDLFGAIASLFE